MSDTENDAFLQRRAVMLSRVVPALSQLLESGEEYTVLSVERIISTAGIARSTFYAYFDDKGHLLRALAPGAVTDILTASGPWSSFPEDGSQADLRAIFSELVATYRRHSAVMAAMAEASVHDRSVEAEFRRMLSTGYDNMVRHVEQGQKTGAVRAGFDAAVMVSWLVSLLERGLYQHVRPADDDDVAKHVDVLTEMVWQTLYRGTPGRD